MYTGPQLGHDGRPIRATPTRIAASLAEGIIHGTNILRTRLREQAFPSTDPKRFNSEECLLECVLFEWFLRDLVISVEFGRHRPTICRALVERLRLAVFPPSGFCNSTVCTSRASPNTHTQSRSRRRFKHWAPLPG